MDLETILGTNERVFVDFWAVWCGPCKMTTPLVHQLKKDRIDVKVVEVNVEDEPELIKSLGISSIPTFRYYENGELIEERIGAISKDQMIEMIDKNK